MSCFRSQYRRRQPLLTLAAAKSLVEKGAGLILFVGGDETARDMSESIDRKMAVLGIPCGVKNCSAVFAVSPEAAGEVTASHLRGAVSTIDTEVLGFNESLMREDKIATKICALLRVPSSKHFMQGAKTGSYTPDEEDEQNGIAKFIVEDMNPQFQHISGLGSTTNQIARSLGLRKTLLGVDIIFKGKMLVRDVGGHQLETMPQRAACEADYHSDRRARIHFSSGQSTNHTKTHQNDLKSECRGSMYKNETVESCAAQVTSRQG